MKKQFAAIGLSLAMSVCLFAVAPAGASAAETGGTVREETRVFDTANHYNYRLDAPFDRSPDSFEAWIRVPGGSLGGTIMGNWVGRNFKYTGCVNWEIDAIGRVKVSWDSKNFEHTFEDVYVDDGAWHHIAIVRDEAEQTFTLWLDGEVASSVEADPAGSINRDFPMNVGVDYSNWSDAKEPFEGDIRQITVYTGAITEERIRADMQNADIKDDFGGTLLGNWTFGEKWTERYVSETSGNGNNASIYTFEKYVQVAETGAYDYMLVVIPDIQTMVRYNKQNLTGAMTWLADNAAEKKMAFAMQVGDLSDVGTEESYYAAAAEGMSILDGKLPYSFVPGNHDYDNNCSTTARPTSYFNRYFPYAKYSATETFGGAYEEGYMENTYNLFEAGGVKYCVINLEFGPRLTVLRWAGRVCEQYSDRRIIINTHNFLGPSGHVSPAGKEFDATSYQIGKNGNGESAETMLEAFVKKYANIFLVVSGHQCTDDVYVRKYTGEHGNTVTSILVDTQAMEISGGGIGEDPVLLMKFNEKKKKVSLCLYSAKYDKCFNIQNQFTLSFADESNPNVGGV